MSRPSSHSKIIEKGEEENRRVRVSLSEEAATSSHTIAGTNSEATHPGFAI
jgi:hypothetical protein